MNEPGREAKEPITWLIGRLQREKWVNDDMPMPGSARINTLLEAAAIPVQKIIDEREEAITEAEQLAAERQLPWKRRVAWALRRIADFAESL